MGGAVGTTGIPCSYRACAYPFPNSLFHKMADSVKAVSEVLSSFQKKEGATIQPKEFFWDQFLKYITSAILALTVLNVSIEFLRGGGVSCFPPSNTLAVIREELEGGLYEFARGQTSYINSYCARNVPITEYFPIYILVHGLLLIAPHYVWSAIHNGDFDSFFAIVEKLDRLRDSSTGEYDAKNFDRVTKLELEYSGTKIFVSYILKLVLQLFVCIGSIVFSAAYFVNFSFSFYCPEEVTSDMPDGWPLNITVPCVYTSLRILGLIRYADFVLLSIALLLVLFGLVWCCVRHTEQLGHLQIAKFSFHSCLNADSYIFPSLVSWPGCPCFAKLKKSERNLGQWVQKLWIFTHYPMLHLNNVFSPRILHDLDFLLLMLFRADSSHGQVFKDIQINKYLKVLVGRDHQLLHLFINVQQDLAKSIHSRMENRPKNVRDKESTGNENGGNFQSAVEMKDSESSDSESSDSDVEDDSEEVINYHKYYIDDEENENVEQNVFKCFERFLGNLEYDEELFSGMRDWIYRFARRFGPKREPGSKLLRNNSAIDISFGTVGFARVLARPFVRVLSMDFHPFYSNPEQTAERKDFYTNHTMMRFPHDIFTQDNKRINDVSDLLKDYFGRFEVDFIVVGPLVEEPKKVIVSLLINLLCTKDCIGKDAVLLAIRPLKVGSKKLTDRFYTYKPPKQLFKAMKKLVRSNLKKDKDTKGLVREVDKQKGFEVMLGQIPCVFEFFAYKYKLTPKAKDKSKSSSTDSESDAILEKIKSLPPPPPPKMPEAPQQPVDSKAEDTQSHSSC